MKKMVKKLIICNIILLLVICIFGTNVHAILQANVPDANNVSLDRQTISQFFEAIRNMETEHGALGKKSNIDSTTALDSSKNGIDCHMALCTEWGTAAMLAASNYGITPATNSEETTTGNESGVYQMANSTGEYTSGLYGTSGKSIDKIISADVRYKNEYSDSVPTISGDAISETDNWSTSQENNIYRARTVGVNNSVWGKGIFCFGGFGHPRYWALGESYESVSSRAVVVCGKDL